MSKTLWHTIKLEVPKEMVNITKKDKVVVKKSLTKTNNISKSNKEPSIKIIPGDTNKPKIISDGKEWNVEELKIKMKKAKELGKKNEGKEYKKKTNIDEKFRKFKDENVAFTNDTRVEKTQGSNGLKYPKKRIFFDNKSRFEKKLFYGTVPNYHFEKK
jgi:predicted metallo-beta-lactamase superfamily hydrolase